MALSGVKEIVNGILEKARGIPEKAKGFFKKTSGTGEVAKGFFDEIKGLFFDLSERIQNAINRVGDHVGPGKKRPLLIGFGALAALFLILVIAGVSNARKRRVVAPDAAVAGMTVAVEELFIPAEPDFVPEFLLERESRSFWSLDDIRQYWKVPRDSQMWKDEIKSVVDKLMESVK